MRHARIRGPIERVRQAIAADLSGDRALDRLADVAALSRFHFHRIFHAMTGETVAEAVRRAWLNRAAVLLATTARPVPAVAAAVGYPNTDSFARACRAAFGTTPQGLRARAVVPPPLLPRKPGALPMHPVAIETYAPRTLACLPHRGAYTAIGETFARLAADFGARGLWPRVTGAAVAIYYDDPAAVPVADLRAHAGMPVAGPVPEGFDAVVTAGGRVAVLTLKGPYTGIPAAWAWLYGSWLPDAGEEPADTAPWEEYPNGPADTAPDALITRICVPLKG